nr:hypothetical protein [Tanacetum cinerariifolium]
MLDELLNPPPSVDHQAAEVIAPIADIIPSVQADLTGSPSSTTVDQDAPSPTRLSQRFLIRLGLYRGKESIVITKESLLMKLQPCGNWSRELTDNVIQLSSSGPALNEMTPATISSGLVQKSSFSTPYIPPSRND